ncbi:Mediator of RNA polymerase II transcription subunit 1.1 [Frankliniella fusca]|uniref:Mediator of RNA polymerase II transcription subunit 1.1 n=1 Tax=Frankliniella fusca TaxID=407009 RepID=A0AAE1LGI6_9NEOP|nr:Mediator of RNA polymerase II transcription subunit 1.1 [Frankliniella fusca]
MDVLPAVLLLLAAQCRASWGILSDGGSGPLLGEQLGDRGRDQGGARCASRMQRELDSMRRGGGGAGGAAGARAGLGLPNTIDLTGYALHQPLRSAPYDMYVTGMRVRVPGQAAWVRVERCQFDARNHSLDTRLLFRDLTVTGHVKLYEDGVRPVPAPAGACTMTLRLRRAGLGFTAVPARPLLPLPLPLAGPGRRDGLAPLEVRTDARFVDPDFVSVYAHGCPAPASAVHIEHRSDDGLHLPRDGEEPSQDLSQDDASGKLERSRARVLHQSLQHPLEVRDDDTRDLSAEMEDVFLRGIRTLLARYMERRLQPALRDTVMAGMGYSVSYGR